MLKLTLFAAMVLALFGARSNADAYELLPGRWDHACLTTDGTPQLVAALAKWAAVSGVRDCGVSAKPDLRSIPALPAAYQSAIAGSAFPVSGGWAVSVRDDFAGDEWVWLHELGHALGLEHSESRDAVMSVLPRGRLIDPQPDDIAGIRALFEPPRRPFRTWVSGLAN